MSSDRRAEFWRSFEEQAPVVASLIAKAHLQEAFQVVERLLGESGYDFCFELTEIDHEAALVLTPEGDPEVARRIDALIEAKPSIAGWRVFGRRQRKSLKDALAFVREIYDVDLGAATFELRSVGREYGVTMFSPASQGLNQSEAEGLVKTFLDHAIGEELVMSKISSVDVMSSGRGALSASAFVAELAEKESNVRRDE